MDKYTAQEIVEMLDPIFQKYAVGEYPEALPDYLLCRAIGAGSVIADVYDHLETIGAKLDYD